MVNRSLPASKSMPIASYSVLCKHDMDEHELQMLLMTVLCILNHVRCMQDSKRFGFNMSSEPGEGSAATSACSRPLHSLAGPLSGRPRDSGGSAAAASVISHSHSHLECDSTRDLEEAIGHAGSIWQDGSPNSKTAGPPAQQQFCHGQQRGLQSHHAYFNGFGLKQAGSAADSKGGRSGVPDDPWENGGDILGLCTSLQQSLRSMPFGLVDSGQPGTESNIQPQAHVDRGSFFNDVAPNFAATGTVLSVS